jgi:hypothetical protein
MPDLSREILEAFASVTGHMSMPQALLIINPRAGIPDGRTREGRAFVERQVEALHLEMDLRDAGLLEVIDEPCGATADDPGWPWGSAVTAQGRAFLSRLQGAEDPRQMWLEQEAEGGQDHRRDEVSHGQTVPRFPGPFSDDCMECDPLWEGAGHFGGHMTCHGCGMDMMVRRSGWTAHEIFVAQYDAAGDHHPECIGGKSDRPHGEGCDDGTPYVFDGYRPYGEQWARA